MFLTRRSTIRNEMCLRMSALIHRNDEVDCFESNCKLCLTCTELTPSASQPTSGETHIWATLSSMGVFRERQCPICQTIGAPADSSFETIWATQSKAHSTCSGRTLSVSHLSMRPSLPARGAVLRSHGSSMVMHEPLMVSQTQMWGTVSPAWAQTCRDYRDTLAQPYHSQPVAALAGAEATPHCRTVALLRLSDAACLR